MTAPAPTVSIIVPMHQSGWSIKDTLDSIQAQTLADIEAVIVNDGSTDDGPGIARRISGTDARFRVIDQPNAGLASARNTGVEAARGRYVSFLDADDLLAPRGLERLVRHAERSGSAGVFGRVEFREVSGRPTGWSPMLDRRVLGLEQIKRGCPFAVHAQLIRRDALAGHRFDPARRIGEDWDLWLRLARSGVVWSGIDAVVASYRMTPASLSRSPRAMWEAMRSTALAHGADAVLDELALEWAVAAAFTGPDQRSSVAEAIALLGEAGVRSTSPETAALKVFHRGAWCAGFAPNRWRRAGQDGDIDAALSRAAALWRALADTSPTPESYPDRAAASLAGLSATPDLVAEALVNEAAPRGNGAVLLVGLGHNARSVAEALARRGIPMLGIDDACPPGTQPPWAEDLGVQIDVLTPDHRLPTPGRAIVTPTQDGPLLERFGGLVGGAARWSATHARLAGDLSGRFRRLIGREERRVHAEKPTSSEPWANAAAPNRR